MFSAYTNIKKLLVCAAILAALPTAADAVSLQATTTIYYPGSTFTLVKGVNDYGELVGEYWTYANGKSTTHAFYYDGSAYHNIDRNLSGSLNEAWGINNAGVIAADGNEGGVYGGYYGEENNFTDFSGTLFDINDVDMMVGSVSGQPIIYDIAQDSYANVNVPWGTSSAAVGMNNLGQVVGSYWTSGSTFIPHGYLFDGTGYTQIDYPNATSTRSIGINDAGQIVGSYVDASGEHGYLYDSYSEVFTTIDLPNASDTRIYDINIYGMLVGDYVDAGGVHRGFIATMVPVPPALLLFGSGLAGLAGMTRLRRGHTQHT